MTTYARFSLAAALALATGSSPLAAVASPTGGFDSVTLFVPASDPAPVPGNYQADFQKAASFTPTAAPHMPFGLGKIVQAASNAAAMFQAGVAEKHYIGTTKQRIDNVGLGTADITDCAARTLTHLDLKAKTYTVTSLDQPAAQTPQSSGGNGQPGPAPTDDGSKLAIDMTTRALGAMKLEGVDTNGYDMKMKVTATKANGETSTFNTDVIEYFSAIPDPHFECVNPRASGGSGFSSPATLQFGLIMRALASSKGNPRFSVTNSGPAVPTGRLSMWELMTMQGADKRGGSGSISIENERGNVHTVADSDPAFKVPPDFKKI